MNLKEFEEELNKHVFSLFNCSIEELDKSSIVLTGNMKLTKELVKYEKSLETIERAQYGRCYPILVNDMIQHIQLTSDDYMFELGCGIGSIVFQIGCMYPCERIFGIELCKNRYEIAMQLKKVFRNSKCIIHHGDFRDFERIIPEIGSVLFINNAHDVFGTRSAKPGCQTLDWSITRIICKMKLGTRIICLTPFIELDHFPLNQCYERLEFISGTGQTSWTRTSRTEYFIYKKIKKEWFCPNCKQNHQDQCPNIQFVPLLRKRAKVS